MYVRITRGQFQPERIDDVEALSSSIAEAIKILPGFLGYQGGVGRNSSTIVAISTWEDRGSAEFRAINSAPSSIASRHWFS